MHWVYADFHKALVSPFDAGLEAVPLVCWGTLKDLSRHGILLKPGMPLMVYMDSCELEDMAYPGVARFDSDSGTWWVEYDPETLHYPPRQHDYGGGLVCWSCKTFVRDLGVHPGERCASCGVPLEAPWAPPE